MTMCQLETTLYRSVPRPTCSFGEGNRLRAHDEPGGERPSFVEAEREVLEVVQAVDFGLGDVAAGAPGQLSTRLDQRASLPDEVDERLGLALRLDIAETSQHELLHLLGRLQTSDESISLTAHLHESLKSALSQSHLLPHEHTCIASTIASTKGETPSSPVKAAAALDCPT